MKWGQFDRANPTLKKLLASWTFYTILNGFRSFNAENLGSVGKRVAKWSVIKLWEWFEPVEPQIQANWFKWGQGCAPDFFLRPPTLTSSNFKVLWPTDLIFTALKDLEAWPSAKWFGYRVNSWSNELIKWLFETTFLLQNSIWWNHNSVQWNAGRDSWN